MRLRSEVVKKKMKEIKKELNIKDQHIAENFGYSNAQSYRSSRGRVELDNGLVWLYDLIQENKKANQND